MADKIDTPQISFLKLFLMALPGATNIPRQKPGRR